MNRHPTVVFALWTGNPGGAENHTWRLCAALKHEHFDDVRVLFWHHDGVLGERLRSDGVETASLNLSTGWRGICGYAKARRLLRAWSPSVLVCSSYSWEHLLLLCAHVTVPVIVVEHGGALLNSHMFSRRNWLLSRVSRATFSRRVSAEVCVSEFIRDRQAKVAHSKNLALIRNGVDTVAFKPGERAGDRSCLRIAAAGRLDPEKGFDLLVRAIARANELAGRPCLLSIAGTGSADSSLRRIVHELGLDGRVSLVGGTTDMPDFWRRHDVACMPSTSRCIESFGMVAAEAQACGLSRHRVTSRRASGDCARRCDRVCGRA